MRILHSICPSSTDQWSPSKVLLEQQEKDEQIDNASKRKVLRSLERSMKKFTADNFAMLEFHRILCLSQ